MTDPYNSYQNHAPATPATRTPPALPQRDHISTLKVSDKWKTRFRTIERAGGPDLPKFRELSTSDRLSVQFNWIAFILGPFYFLAKGLWRQAVVYVLAAIACVLIMEAMGLGRFSRVVGYGFAVVYSLRANISYYKKVVLDEAPWF